MIFLTFITFFDKFNKASELMKDERQNSFNMHRMFIKKL